MYTEEKLAESNAQFVARAARIVREYGNDVASPADAREIFTSAYMKRPDAS